MSTKLKANFTINIEKVLERVKSYPNISKVIQPQLEDLSQLKRPPFIEQVHEVIYWLHRFTETSKKLLNELEGILSRIEGYDINNKKRFLKKLGTAKDKANFNSVYSELCLANFFIKNGVNLSEFEPLAKGGERKADFKICLGDTNVIVELITPGELPSDFQEKEAFLFKRLERIQSGGLSVKISGFESYDSSNLWRSPVNPPSYKQLEEMITKFRKVASNISDEELPKELPPLCHDYPRIKVTALERMRTPDYEGTYVFSISSRATSGFPIDRIVHVILDEKKHLSSHDFNFVFVDFSYWSRIERHFLDSPVHRKILIKELKKNMSSRIDGVFTYIVSNQKDESLVNRRVLYLNPNEPCLGTSEVKSFLKFWKAPSQVL